MCPMLSNYNCAAVNVIYCNDGGEENMPIIVATMVVMIMLLMAASAGARTTTMMTTMVVMTMTMIMISRKGKKTVEKAKVRKVAQILVTIKALAFSAMKILLPNFMAILVLVTCLLKKVNFHML